MTPPKPSEREEFELKLSERMGALCLSDLSDKKGKRTYLWPCKQSDLDLAWAGWCAARGIEEDSK
jgi:hypothetical protein